LHFNSISKLIIYKAVNAQKLVVSNFTANALPKENCAAINVCLFTAATFMIINKI